MNHNKILAAIFFFGAGMHATLFVFGGPHPAWLYAGAMMVGIIAGKAFLMKPEDIYAVAAARIYDQAHPTEFPPPDPSFVAECWCAACVPQSVDNMRMILCPDCGNKRCPHANNHVYKCTGSNVPGQIGEHRDSLPS